MIPCGATNSHEQCEFSNSADPSTPTTINAPRANYRELSADMYVQQLHRSAHLLQLRTQSEVVVAIRDTLGVGRRLYCPYWIHARLQGTATTAPRGPRAAESRPDRTHLTRTSLPLISAACVAVVAAVADGCSLRDSARDAGREDRRTCVWRHRVGGGQCRHGVVQSFPIRRVQRLSMRTNLSVAVDCFVMRVLSVDANSERTSGLGRCGRDCAASPRCETDRNGPVPTAHRAVHTFARSVPSQSQHADKGEHMPCQ